MAVQNVRLIGASVNGTTTDTRTVGTSTSATAGSGHARMKEVTRETTTMTAVIMVFTATAPIQCPWVCSKVRPQVGQVGWIRNQPERDGRWNKPRPPQAGQAPAKPRARTRTGHAPSTPWTLPTSPSEDLTYYRPRPCRY